MTTRRHHTPGSPMSWIERLRKCPTTGKWCHPSEESAECQLDELEADKGTDPNLNTYQCGACSSWHVGRSSPHLDPRPRRHRP